MPLLFEVARHPAFERDLELFLALPFCSSTGTILTGPASCAPTAWETNNIYKARKFACRALKVVFKVVVV
jgi:hypothetical protein